MSGIHAHSDPHTPHSVTGDAKSDVSAGPGDAGAQDKPRPITSSSEREIRSTKANRFTLWIIIGGLAVTALLFVIFW